MSTQVVLVEPQTFITNDKVIRELRRLYDIEVKTNEVMGLDNEIQIRYYGLELDLDIISSQRLFMESIKEYFQILKDHYRTGSYVRKQSPVVKYYRGLPGMTVEACVAHAIHHARLDIVQAIEDYRSWKHWVFKFQFNSIELEFNPLLISVYKTLLNRTNKIVKR